MLFSLPCVFPSLTFYHDPSFPFQTGHVHLSWLKQQLPPSTGITLCISLCALHSTYHHLKLHYLLFTPCFSPPVHINSVRVDTFSCPPLRVYSTHWSSNWYIVVLNKYLLDVFQINTVLWQEHSAWCFTAGQGKKDYSKYGRYFFPILEGIHKVDWMFSKYLWKRNTNLEQWAIKCCQCRH